MTPISQVIKAYAPFMLTGGGIGMLTNVYMFERGMYHLNNPLNDKQVNDDGVRESIKTGFNASLVAIVFSNVLLGTAKLVAHLSLQHKQIASLNVIFKNIPPLLVGLNLICAYVSIAIKIGMIVARAVIEEANRDNDEEEKIGWMEFAKKSLTEMGYFALTAALGAAGAAPIRKCFPES